MKTMGERIRFCMQQKNLTNIDVADKVKEIDLKRRKKLNLPTNGRLGITKGEISHILNDRHPGVSVWTISNIALALKVDLSWLVYGEYTTDTQHPSLDKIQEMIEEAKRSTAAELLATEKMFNIVGISKEQMKAFLSDSFARQLLTSFPDLSNKQKESVISLVESMVQH